MLFHTPVPSPPCSSSPCLAITTAAFLRSCTPQPPTTTTPAQRQQSGGDTSPERKESPTQGYQSYSNSGSNSRKSSFCGPAHAQQPLIGQFTDTLRPSPSCCQFVNPVSVVLTVVMSQVTPNWNATWSHKVGVASGCVLWVVMLCRGRSGSLLKWIEGCEKCVRWHQECAKVWQVYFKELVWCCGHIKGCQCVVSTY